MLMPLASLGFVLRRPRLYGWVLAPFLINTALLIGMWSAIGGLLVDPVVDFAAEHFSWLGATALAAARLILLLLAFLLSLFASYILFAIISSPFNDFMTEKIEDELLADYPHLKATPLPIVKAILHALCEAGIRICIVLPLVVVAFVLGFIPFVGPIIAGGISLANGVLFLSIDAYSYCMDRRRIDLPAKMAWLRARRNRWLPFGFGLAVFFAVPCSVLLLPMLAAVAATRLYCASLIEEDEAAKLLPAASEDALAGESAGG